MAWTNSAYWDVTDSTCESTEAGHTTSLCYDQVSTGTQSDSKLQFLLNDTLLYERSVENNVSDFYGCASSYEDSVKFTASLHSNEIRFTLDNTVWQDNNGMDSWMGINADQSPAFEQIDFAFATGQRSGNKTLEIWEGGSSSIVYTAVTTLNAFDVLKIRWAAAPEPTGGTLLPPPIAWVNV